MGLPGARRGTLPLLGVNRGKSRSRVGSDDEHERRAESEPSATPGSQRKGMARLVDGGAEGRQSLTHCTPRPTRTSRPDFRIMNRCYPEEFSSIWSTSLKTRLMSRRDIQAIPHVSGFGGPSAADQARQKTMPGRRVRSAAELLSWGRHECLDGHGMQGRQTKTAHARCPNHGDRISALLVPLALVLTRRRDRQRGETLGDDTPGSAMSYLG